MPFDKFSAVSAVTIPPTFMLPSIKFVPAGIVSFTVTVSGAVPVELSSVIIYVISSPASTFAPLSGTEVLLNLTFGLFTVSVTSSVGISSTVAIFPIVLQIPHMVNYQPLLQSLM